MNKNILAGVVAVLVIIGWVYFVFANQSAPADTPDTTTQMPVVTSGENAPEGSIHNLQAEPAAEAARIDLAAKLSVPANSIVIMKVEGRTWNDGCLGLGGPSEICSQALVDGFHVELLANGETYFYRTDKTGTNLRAEK